MTFFITAVPYNKVKCVCLMIMLKHNHWCYEDTWWFSTEPVNIEAGQTNYDENLSCKIGPIFKGSSL